MKCIKKQLKHAHIKLTLLMHTKNRTLFKIGYKCAQFLAQKEWLLNLSALLSFFTSVALHAMDQTQSYNYLPYSHEPIEIHKTSNGIEIEKNGVRVSVKPYRINFYIKPLGQNEIDELYRLGCIAVRQTITGDYIISAHGSCIRRVYVDEN